MNQREKMDNVTIGQIRKRYLSILEDQIKEISRMIRLGYHNRHPTEKFLSEQIGGNIGYFK